jgi:translation initiation factor 2B subunit (eIF-2B alpha/beta/delta family)
MDLEDWAIRAAQALQEVIDETEKSEGSEDCAHDLKELLAELDQILKVAPPLNPSDQDAVRNLAVQCGFKLKQQADGRMDLDEYVYQFAEHLLTINVLRGNGND